MIERTTEDKSGITGRIDVYTYDEQRLRNEIDNWDELDDAEKIQATRRVEPDDFQMSFNTTVDDLHEYFVDNLDPDNTGSEANVSIQQLGLGNDDSAPATSDTDLTSRQYSEAVDDVVDNGASILASTFLDSGEANGFTIKEVGLYSGDPANLGSSDVFLFNHSTIADINKTNSETVVIDVTLTFSAA